MSKRKRVKNRQVTAFSRKHADRSFVDLNYDDNTRDPNNDQPLNNPRNHTSGHELKRYQMFANGNYVAQQKGDVYGANLGHKNPMNLTQSGQYQNVQELPPDLDQSVLNVLYHQPLLPGYSDLNKFKIQKIEDNEHIDKKLKTGEIEPQVNSKDEVNTMLEKVGLQDGYSDEEDDEDEDEDGEDEDEEDDEDCDNRAHTSGPLDKDRGQRPAFPIPKLAELLQQNQIASETTSNDSSNEMDCSYQVLEYLARVKHEVKQRPSFVAIPKHEKETLQKVMSVAQTTFDDAGGRKLKSYQDVRNDDGDPEQNKITGDNAIRNPSLQLSVDAAEKPNVKTSKEDNKKQSTSATRFRQLFETESINLDKQWYTSFITSFKATKHKLSIAIKMKQSAVSNNNNNNSSKNTFTEWKKYLVPTSTTLPTPSLLSSLTIKTLYDLLSYVDRCLLSQRTVSEPFSKWVYALLARCPEVVEAHHVALLREIAKKCIRISRRSKAKSQAKENGKESVTEQEKGLRPEMCMFIETTVAIVAGCYGQSDLVCLK